MPPSSNHKLTARKALTVIEKGFEPSGVVLINPATGARCIVEMSAVRWLSNGEMWWLMHDSAQPDQPPLHESAQPATDTLIGRLVWAGDLTVNGEEMTGCAVELSPENLKGKPIPMYQDVAIVPTAILDGWTVRFEDWKRMADAAGWLARACKDRLPPGHFDKLDEEYRAVRAILSPNDQEKNAPAPLNQDLPCSTRAQYIPFLDIPEEIHASAQTLHTYFEQRGMREWEFSAVADRRLVTNLEQQRNILRAALEDCVMVMERDLKGLTVIQPELKQAKEALLSAPGSRPKFPTGNGTQSEIHAIGERLRTQDNLATAHPMFCVQEKKRDIGYDPRWVDQHCWRDSKNDETIFDDDPDFKEPDGDEWEKFRYVDRWETVMVAFTAGGCQEYINLNGHNHRGELRIYAESFRRCPEMLAIREFLLAAKTEAGNMVRPEDPPWWPQYAREHGFEGTRFLDIMDCQKEHACAWAKSVWRVND